MTYKTLKQIRHEAIYNRLQAFGGCVQGAASSLDITRNTVYRELTRKELDAARGGFSGQKKETKDQKSKRA